MSEKHCCCGSKQGKEKKANSCGCNHKKEKKAEHIKEHNCNCNCH